MRSDGVVIHAPLLNEESDFLEVDEPFLVETFIPKTAIEGFDVGILCGLTSINAVQLHLAFSGTHIELVASELRAIVNLQELGLPPLKHLPIQDAHHPLAAQAGVDLYGQTAWSEHVDDVQSAKAAPIAQPVARKVYRPYLVRRLWRLWRSSLLTLEPFAVLGPEIELLLFVEAISSLGVEIPDLQA